MKTRNYEILNIPIQITSNNDNILQSLDKAYCCFSSPDTQKIPELEVTIITKDGQIPDLKNLEIFAITPSSFDGWAYSSEIWCGKSIFNRYVFEVPGLSRGEQDSGKKTFEIKTRVNPPGIKAGWLMQVHFHVYLFVLEQRKNFHVVHGGALEYNNKGLILAGIAGAGKTTLTYALAKAGFGYLTDESIILDIDNQNLLPYPVSPSFEKDSAPLFEEVRESFTEDKKLHNDSVKSFLNIKKLKIKSVNNPVKPEVIIFPKYSPDKKPNLKPLSKAQATDFLNNNIFSFQKPEEQKISNKEAAQWLTEKCECYELVSNQLNETVQLVKETL